MRINRAWKGVMFALCVTVAFFLFGFVTKGLWNWLMPSLFGLHLITFWQAIGLLFLGKLLFGGFRGRPRGRMYWRRRMFERWERMTPEEREKFRQGMRSRCAPFGADPAATAAEPRP